MIRSLHKKLYLSMTIPSSDDITGRDWDLEINPNLSLIFIDKLSLNLERKAEQNVTICSSDRLNKYRMEYTASAGGRSWRFYTTSYSTIVTVEPDCRSSLSDGDTDPNLTDSCVWDKSRIAVNMLNPYLMLI